MRYFSALIKPASSLCNMRCSYCFYHDEAAGRDQYSYGTMARSTAEALIDKAYADGGRACAYSFAFQGGEPTLAGRDFFAFFTEYARRKLPRGAQVSFSIQTNGLLLDDGFCALLAKEGFLVGLSLDGPRDMHDACRVDAGGAGTHARVMAAAARLKKHGAQFNILAVVTRRTARHPDALFAFFARAGFDHIQLIPCLSALDGEKQPFDLSGADYSRFMRAMFRLWCGSIARGKPVSIRQFDNLAAMAVGMPPEQCGMRGFCTPQLVVEADGTVFPCDFYALDEYRCGNIATDSLEEIAASEGMRRFIAHQEPTSGLCADCPVARYCGGGCRRYRAFYREKAGFCPNRDFLEYAAPMLPGAARALYGL